MRIFSEFEKKIIERMIELDGKSGSLNVLGNIYDSFSQELSLPDYCYIQIVSETDVSIQIIEDMIAKIDPSSLRIFDNELSKFLLTTVKLFEYLENNGLAYFIGDLNLKSIGQVWKDTKYTTFEFLEAESKKLLYKYARKKIYVTEELTELFNKKFKSTEQIRHEEVLDATKKELLHTRIALFLTIFGLIASILIPFLSSNQIEVTKEITVKNLDSISIRTTEQMHELITSIDKISSEVNELQNDVARQLKEIDSPANVLKKQKKLSDNIKK